MNTLGLIRSIASVLLSGAVLSTAVVSLGLAERSSASGKIGPGTTECDPLDTELFRCALLGPDAAADASCQAAFACRSQRLFSPCGPGGERPIDLSPATHDSDSKTSSRRSRHHGNRFRPK